MVNFRPLHWTRIIISHLKWRIQPANSTSGRRPSFTGSATRRRTVLAWLGAKNCIVRVEGQVTLASSWRGKVQSAVHWARAGIPYLIPHIPNGSFINDLHTLTLSEASELLLLLMVIFFFIIIIMWKLKTILCKLQFLHTFEFPFPSWEVASGMLNDKKSEVKRWHY